VYRLRTPDHDREEAVREEYQRHIVTIQSHE
jgi:hypothetical protein